MKVVESINMKQASVRARRKGESSVQKRKQIMY